MQFSKVIKRNGAVVDFDIQKIESAILKAGTATKEFGPKLAHVYASMVNGKLSLLKHTDLYAETDSIGLETIQDVVEQVLFAGEHRQTAKAYCLWRDQRRVARESVTNSQVDLINKYIDIDDWKIKENSNMAYSLQGLHNYLNNALSSEYWLHHIYPKEIAECHKSGDFHIHDLGMIAPYCCGWSLEDLLVKGFTGVANKISSSPAKHFRTALGQLVNFIFTLQGECVSEDTEVLTSNGWKFFYDLLPTDAVRVLNRDTKEIHYELPKRIIDKTYIGDMIHIENDDIDQLVTPLHTIPFLDVDKTKIRTSNNLDDEATPLTSSEVGKIKQVDYIGTIKTTFANAFEKGAIIFDDSLLSFVEKDNHVKLIEYSGKVYCVETEAGIIYTKRNGKASWTGNCAGAQAVSNFDTLLAPFVRFDELSYPQVKQAMQEFIFNMNVPTRVGFQCVPTSYECLTPDGWKTYDELEEGDVIFVVDLVTKKVKTDTLLKVNLYNYHGKMMNYKGEDFNFITTPDHRQVFVDEDDDWQINTSEVLFWSHGQIPKRSIEIPVLDEDELVFDGKDLEETELASMRIMELLHFEGRVWCPSTSTGTFICRNDSEVPFVTGNCPFSNITMDLQVPAMFAELPVIHGGKRLEMTYKEFQPEVDMINKAFCEVMTEGDSQGRIFSFPIPTYNIDKDFDWDNEAHDALWTMTGKRGIPYFSNFVNSDMNPEDARSMCCRLRLDNKELRKRGGGLFGANPLTGSLNVITINLPRLGYVSSTKEEFLEKLDSLLEKAKQACVIKRKALRRFTEKGMYPYAAFYLTDIKARTGDAWINHFNTIGINGMNEACLNFMGKTVGSEEGKAFALEVMDHIRARMIEFQEETGELFNLEATPAEATAYTLALKDRKLYPEIISASSMDNIPFYTNSTHLPVDFTDDIFELLDLQDELQTKYTGGTVIHVFIGEEIRDPKIVKNLVRRVCENYKLPYFSITPTFSTCDDHGYLSGEQHSCPTCGKETEIYSRVVGYYRPTKAWNESKQIEFGMRKTFGVPQG